MYGDQLATFPADNPDIVGVVAVGMTVEGRLKLRSENERIGMFIASLSSASVWPRGGHGLDDLSSIGFLPSEGGGIIVAVSAGPFSVPRSGFFWAWGDRDFCRERPSRQKGRVGPTASLKPCLHSYGPEPCEGSDPSVVDAGVPDTAEFTVVSAFPALKGFDSSRCELERAGMIIALSLSLSLSLLA
jgi:hypothetical protein